MKWHWLDGSTVDNSIIQWCPNSSYEIAIGAHCAAYDSTLQCVNNYPCNTLLPAPCAPRKNRLIWIWISPFYWKFVVDNAIDKQSKSIILSRQGVINIGICTTSYGGLYANWWTYSSLLLNWFILFSFYLYLCNRFTLNKNTTILTGAIIILSSILIIVYAILWGVQCKSMIECMFFLQRSFDWNLDNDIIDIPLAIVIIGSIASALELIAILIILNNRTRSEKNECDVKIRDFLCSTTI